MTNKEAVNWIINLSADIGKSEHSELWHYEQALCEIREILESAQQWIPVSSGKLPEKHNSVIVTDFGHVTLAYTNNLGEWMDYDGNRLKNVTAWMPLPMPYKGGAE